VDVANIWGPMLVDQIDFYWQAHLRPRSLPVGGLIDLT
jgi:hypothetical protein